MTVRIVGILNKTGEEARILVRKGKTNGKENYVDFLVPMSRAAVNAIKSLEKKPIFIWLSLGITQGRSNNVTSSGGRMPWQNAFLQSTWWRGQCFSTTIETRNQKPKRAATKNRSKAVAFAPDMIFVVAKDDNPRFFSKRIEILITFYSKDTHRRDSIGSPFLAESVIFAQCNLAVGVHTLDDPVVFEETV